MKKKNKETTNKKYLKISPEEYEEHKGFFELTGDIPMVIGLHGRDWLVVQGLIGKLHGMLEHTRGKKVEKEKVMKEVREIDMVLTEAMNVSKDVIEGRRNSRY